jgi:hypothetical protein
MFMILMLLGVLTKLRKATITFTFFVCLSVSYTSAHPARIFLRFLLQEWVFDY